MLFEFKDNERPASYVSSVASCMQLFPAEYTLSGGYLFRRFDPALIGSILAMLTPDRLRCGRRCSIPLAVSRVACWRRHKEACV